MLASTEASKSDSSDGEYTHKVTRKYKFITRNSFTAVLTVSRNETSGRRCVESEKNRTHKKTLNNLVSKTQHSSTSVLGDIPSRTCYEK
ncbi:hypothetical protein TNIN_160921 [Trichonephila inaurata madagascariensis]|uniref:Uncharacterized protein n=1 Tax=Trichonephila inaurata madagascariensis TaxID=2747483 RepID=A0A8X6Y920_9ARAC|nr:hypothetical protein TNIN_160921 [Trichonephila inaurata madagascariensis]